MDEVADDLGQAPAGAPARRARFFCAFSSGKMGVDGGRPLSSGERPKVSATRSELLAQRVVGLLLDADLEERLGNSGARRLPMIMTRLPSCLRPRRPVDVALGHLALNRQRQICFLSSSFAAPMAASIHPPRPQLVLLARSISAAICFSRRRA